MLQHLSLHVDAARSRGENSLGSVPDERAIARMIDAAFWASLRREEGIAPKVSLAFLTRAPSVLAIPKASSADHAAENAAAGDLNLTDADIAALDRAFPRGLKPRGLPML